MDQRIITQSQLHAFGQYLLREEKSTATVEKYLRDSRAFVIYLAGRPVTKEEVLAYKQQLLARNYALRSINSMLASLNSLLSFLGWSDCHVRALKQQKQVYCAPEKELTRGEYLKLLEAAGACEQLHLVMQTICSTGIRVSELAAFSVEGVRQGETVVRCKGKSRTILIPGKLRKLLLAYARKKKIRSGAIFLARNGKPLDRRWIWARMKSLCRKAGIDPRKVFPPQSAQAFCTELLPDELPVVWIDGYEYIGYLSFPDWELHLPVMAKWDYERLKLAPCRHFGSSLTDDLVIAAHNYDTHFGGLSKLEKGSKILFTDMEGNVNHYALQYVKTLDPDQVDAVQNSGYDLVLYTCTIGGSYRVVAFCDRVPEEA